MAGLLATGYPQGQRAGPMMLALPQRLEPALYNAVAALLLIRRLVIPALASQCTQNPREVA